MLKQLTTGVVLASTVILNGCAETGNLHYLNESEDVRYYKDHATAIEFPHVPSEPDPDAVYSQAPRTISLLTKDEVRDMTLEEVRNAALMNSRVIRSRGAFLSPGNSILSNPSNTASVYDPAIQESGVLFGGRGIEAALSAFDATFQTTANWARNEQVRNSVFTAGVPSGAASVAETANVNSSLSKVFGYGGSFSLNHNVAYTGINAPASVVFAPSSYTGNVSAQYRHPLLAGSGTEFTQIAGPISAQFGGITGVTQGVVIARINHDITLTQFEQSVTNLLKDVEDAYWDLYLQYHIYDTSVVAMKSAQYTWHVAKRKQQVGGIEGFSVEDEAQARDRYFDTKANVQMALSQLYQTEGALRRLIGLPVNDGQIIRPSDDPITAKIDPDWAVSVADAMTHRLELRRQKWNIKSLELQLKAAQNLVRPRLDFVAGYQVNGFGDQLINYNDGQPLNSFYSLLTQNNHTGWNAGFTFALPIGLRSAKAQVRNIELRITKARDVLSAQEMEISHEVANAYQLLAEAYATAKTYFNRRQAAQRQVEVVQKKYDQGTQTVDLLVRAQSSLADAESAYFRAVVAYQQAIVNLQYRQGTLLAFNDVTLAEGDWDTAAYDDALRRAKARTNGFDTSKLQTTEPIEFVEHDADWEGLTVWPLREANPGDDADDTTKKPTSAPNAAGSSDPIIPQVPAEETPASQKQNGSAEPLQIKPNAINSPKRVDPVKELPLPEDGSVSASVQPLQEPASLPRSGLPLSTLGESPSLAKVSPSGLRLPALQPRASVAPIRKSLIRRTGWQATK